MLFRSVVVLSGEAVIAVDGSYGTLSEIAHAMQYGVPVVGLATWTFTADRHEEPQILRARDAVEAVKMAVEAARARREAV